MKKMFKVRINNEQFEPIYDDYPREEIAKVLEQIASELKQGLSTGELQRNGTWLATWCFE
jgi:hypothetical protein